MKKIILVMFLNLVLVSCGGEKEGNIEVRIIQETPKKVNTGVILDIKTVEETELEHMRWIGENF